jgi:predicted ATPase
MLTRLRVSGFKNLVDVDVRFGPFTCIAGANGAGKSNLLDAILFLGALADRTLIDAALSVRDQGAKTGDIRGLFHHSGERFAEEMMFEVEMIVPPEGVDDLGRPFTATATLVRYSLSLRYRAGDEAHSQSGLEITHEELIPLSLTDADRHLGFAHRPAWRQSVVHGVRRHGYISTEGGEAERRVHLHPDGGSDSKPQTLVAARLPRSVLSAAHAAEAPTAALVRREMRSWKLLQLEPAALREPDSLTAPTEMAPDGGHLAATLYRLAHSPENGGDPEAVYAEVANRLSFLIDDVRRLEVQRDERRGLLTLYATGADGTRHSARSLSEGTLRFLALILHSLEPEPRGLICLEEPENGIHPERIPEMIQLLADLSSEVNENREYDQADGLRQVIINTHSPAVVLQVPEDSLLLASRSDGLQLSCLPGTWRAKSSSQRLIPRGHLLAYLNPVANLPSMHRVVDRADLGQYRFQFEEPSE